MADENGIKLSVRIVKRYGLDNEYYVQVFLPLTGEKVADVFESSIESVVPGVSKVRLGFYLHESPTAGEDNRDD